MATAKKTSATGAAKTPAKKPAKNPATKRIATPAPRKAAKPAAKKKVTPAKVGAPAQPVVTARKPPAPKPGKKAMPAGTAGKAEKTDKLDKAKKPKLVRDSFTIPKAEYAVLDELKQRANRLTRPAKKSELLRAGIKLLAALPDAAFLSALAEVPAIKTGRPSLG